MKKLSLIFSLIPFLVSAQSLSPERVAKIKQATVRIITEDGSIGTGFFINNKGDIVTCMHVIYPPAINGRMKKIYAEFNDGFQIEVQLNIHLARIKSVPKIDSIITYDFCILSPVTPILKKYSFLRIGNFDNALEGAEIYTCGYPLGAKQQFISKGMLSTKYVNKANGFIPDAGDTLFVPRMEALLDITSNRGNSGGAILKIGNTINDDEVIGIADFNVNPLGNKADEIINSFLPMVGSMKQGVIVDSTGKIIREGSDPNQAIILYADAIRSLSIGVSGCVSINYLKDLLKEMKIEGNDSH